MPRDPGEQYAKIGDFAYGDICEEHGVRAAKTILKLGDWMVQHGGFPADRRGLELMLAQAEASELAPTPQSEFLARLLALVISDAADEILERFNDQPDLQKRIRSIGQSVAAAAGRKSRQGKSIKAKVQAWATNEIAKDPAARRDLDKLAARCSAETGAKFSSVRRYLQPSEGFDKESR